MMDIRSALGIFAVASLALSSPAMAAGSSASRLAISTASTSSEGVAGVSEQRKEGKASSLVLSALAAAAFIGGIVILASGGDKSVSP